MIVDIIELAFNEDNMTEYFGAYPTVVPDPHVPDDIYFMGHDSYANITEIFHRYKFIEHISGEVQEHIVLTKDKIQFPLHKNRNIELFPISTRRHTASGPETFRYIKTIANIMYSLNVHTTFKSGIRTIHQVAISAIYNFYGGSNGFAPEVASILSEYCKSRHMELTYLSTASIAETSHILANMLEINQTLSASLFDIEIPATEICSYLDTALSLPRPNLQVGFIRIILAANSNRVNPKWSDVQAIINPTTMGMYAALLPQNKDVYVADKIVSVNSHLSSEQPPGGAGSIEPVLLEVLNHIELSPYTDISIELPFTTNIVPDVTVHYSGSIFNYGTVSHAGYVTNLEMNFSEVLNAFILIYGGPQYYEAQPVITITRTFAEEVYVKYTTEAGEYVECYDLTLMALLSPTILDGEAERFMLSSLMA